MTDSPERETALTWLRRVPPACWLADYRMDSLGRDIVAGVTLAAYAIPVSLAYAGLAGLPPQIGIYGYLLGGLGYALLGSSRQLAIGPTSAISLMIAGTVGAMAEGDAERYGQIASLAGFTVALLCLIAWLLRLSMLVRLISDSILVGFKAGAGLTIVMTQLPSLFGVAGGGHNFFERAVLLAGQLGETHYLVLGCGVAAILLLLLGDRFLPGWPVPLTVVALSIIAALAFGLAALGVPTTGVIPAGLPSLAGPALRLRDVEGIVPLAAGCLVLAYIESVSAARTFAAKHGYAVARSRVESCALADGRSPGRRRDFGSAYGQALVRRQARFLAAGGGSVRSRLPTGRRAVGLPRRKDRGSARLPAPPASHQRVRVAGGHGGDSRAHNNDQRLQHDQLGPGRPALVGGVGFEREGAGDSGATVAGNKTRRLIATRASAPHHSQVNETAWPACRAWSGRARR